ncbi:hypothetical protein AB0J25_01140 [Streptomyces sp. NPDC049910]|uniref:hypothetical protein n=1 Tax=Streptomyces sp. NPDC049910 TaxID=3155278 RepID=UPI00343B563F
MDPVSVGLLAALAGGVGGEMGRQTWAGLSALVRRPFQSGRDSGQAPAASSGEAELVALDQTPADVTRAQALSIALAVRAAVDEEFGNELRQWHERAKLVRTGDGAVINTISGGTQNGPVMQGRDFSGISITTAPPSPAGPEGSTPRRQE